MNVLTLSYGGTEKDFFDWGFAMPMMRIRSRAACTFTVYLPGADPAAALPIPFKGAVKIYMNRTGSGTSWSGGTLIFQGMQTDNREIASPTGRGVELVFSDAWYNLEKNFFQQQWWKKNAGDVSVNTAYFARVWLWQDFSTGGLLSSKDQLTQIINFAATQCGVAIQAGTIDPVQSYPVFPSKAIMCADAINTVLRGMPDTVTYFDYTTTPPTLHIRQRQNLEAVTLPYASSDTGATRSHVSSNVRSRPDLQSPSVVIQYQQVNQSGNTSYLSLITDSFGADATGFALGDIVAPIDLRGEKETFLTGSLKAKAIDVSTAAFWTAHKPDLDDASITSLSVDSGSDSLTDDSGTAIDLTAFPNELIEPGHYAPWMKTTGGTQINVKEAIAKATISYQRKNAAGFVDSTIVKHPVNVRVKVTNSAVGAVNYQTIASYDPGEVVPVGLAYAIWCAINNVVPVIVCGVYTPPGSVPSITSPENLQWEGTHVLREGNISSIITPAKALNLSADPDTGNDPWTAINAVIYDVSIDFYHGRTTIQFGPHKHLSAQEFFEQVMMWRIRFVYDNPNTRFTGIDGAASGQSIATDAKMQNTSSSDVPPKSLDTVSTPSSSNVIIVQKDAVSNGGQVYLAKVTTSNVKASGTVDIRIAINDVPAADVEMSPPDDLPIVAFRQACCTMPDGTTPATAFFLMTYPKAS